MREPEDHDVDPTFPYDLRAFGDRIKTLRVQRGWTQQDLAREARLTVDAIGSYERGVRGPRPDTQKYLADAFGKTREQLLEGLPLRPNPTPLPAAKNWGGVVANTVNTVNVQNIFKSREDE